MKKFAALFILASISALPSYSQEMPAELKTQLKEKAAQLQPSNKAAAKTWLVKQMNAWESIQNLALAADPDAVETIKKLAAKKYPLDFVSQETFITEQAVAAAGLADLKAQIGAAAYASLKKKFDESGESDFNKFVETINAQITAKSQIETLKPLPSIDASTFAITKEVLKKKYPDDFLSQYNELKKFSGVVDNAAKSGANAAAQAAGAAGATGTSAGTTAAAGSAKADKKAPASLAELNVKTREIFNKHTLLVEGKKRVIGVPAEMHGKKVVLIPFEAFADGPNVRIMNNLGEEIEFDPEEIYASKDFPFVIAMIKSLPETTQVATLAEEKDYRKIVGKSIFFMGYTQNNIQIFPIKLNAVSDNTLVLSSRVPNSFVEGTVLINPYNGAILGSMVNLRPKYPDVNWKNSRSVSQMRRIFDNRNNFLTCMRLDKLSRWDKLDFDKLEKQRKKLESANMLLQDFITLNASTRLGDMDKLPTIGATIGKYAKDFKHRMDKGSFDRKFRSYLQDLSQVIKSELRNLDVSSFYPLYGYDMAQTASALKKLSGVYDSAVRSNAIDSLIPDDIKKFSGR